MDVGSPVHGGKAGDDYEEKIREKNLHICLGVCIWLLDIWTGG